MKVCIVNNLFDPYPSGGSGAIAKRTSDALRKAGYEVVVISTKPYFDTADTEKRGYKIYYLSSLFFFWRKLTKIFRYFFHILNFFNFIICLRALKIIKKEKIEFVFTHNLAGFSFLLPLLLAKKIKYAHVLHDVQLLHPSGLLYYGQEKKVDQTSAKIYQWILKKYFKNIKKVISPSSWLLQEHLKRGFFSKAELLVCPNLTETTEYSREDSNKDGKYKILYVGNISKEKGVDILLNVFTDLIKEEPDIKLTLVGQAIDQNIASRIRSQAGIEYMGLVDNKAISDLMLRSNALVVPSICYENSPTVIYEAAAVGLPVIASNIGGIPELINGFGGDLFQPGDEAELKKILRNKIKNPPYRRVKRTHIMAANLYIKKIMNFINGKNH